MATGDVFNVVIPMVNGGTTSAVGTTKYLAFFAPTTAVGGGVTITKWGVTSGSAVGSGSAPAFSLITTTSAGVVNGTVGASGSVSYTAGTPVAGTVSTAFVTQGYGVMLRLEQDQVCPQTLFLNGYVQYVMGK